MKALSCPSLLSVLLAAGAAGCGGLLDLGSNDQDNIISDNALPDNGHPRRVFVTSAQYSGNLGGIAGADAKCAAHASAAGLTGTYLAWLSTSQTTPAQRMTHHAMGYQLVDGTMLASSWDDLVDGAIAHEIDINELGVHHDHPEVRVGLGRIAVVVWSASDAAGNGDTAASESCDDWTTVSPLKLGGLGLLYAVSGGQTFLDQQWSDGSKGSCSADAALYCFEQSP